MLCCFESEDDRVEYDYLGDSGSPRPGESYRYLNYKENIEELLHTTIKIELVDVESYNQLVGTYYHSAGFFGKKEKRVVPCKLRNCDFIFGKIDVTSIKNRLKNFVLYQLTNKFYGDIFVGKIELNSAIKNTPMCSVKIRKFTEGRFEVDLFFRNHKDEEINLNQILRDYFISLA